MVATVTTSCIVIPMASKVFTFPSTHLDFLDQHVSMRLAHPHAPACDEIHEPEKPLCMRVYGRLKEASQDWSGSPWELETIMIGSQNKYLFSLAKSELFFFSAEFSSFRLVGLCERGASRRIGVENKDLTIQWLARGAW